jgi:hypothetical protein
LMKEKTARIFQRISQGRWKRVQAPSGSCEKAQNWMDTHSPTERALP